jgi:hypothetical protein
MTQKKSPRRRTQVKDLPRKEKELSKEEQKKVSGAMVLNISQIPSELMANKPKQ